MFSLPPTGDSGEAHRDAALDLLRQHRTALVRDIRRAAVRLALTAKTFTADDIRAIVVIPDGINPVVVGAAVRALAVAGIIRRDGSRNSERKKAHARPNAVWKLTDRAKAAAWLAAKPPSPPLDQLPRHRARTRPRGRGTASHVHKHEKTAMNFNAAIQTGSTPTTNGGGIDAFDTAAAAPEFAPIPAGIYAARVTKGEYATTRAGAEAYRFRFEITEGEQAGRTVVRTWTFGPKAIAYTKRDLAPFGLTTAAKLLSPFPEPGREYLVRLLVATQKGDDGVERNDIKRIDLLTVTDSPAAAYMLPTSGEGGPK